MSQSSQFIPTKSKKPKPLWSKFCTKENALVALFTVCLVLLHTLYAKYMLLVFNTELWENIDHAIRIVSNLVLFHERPLVRNMVFNTFRCMANEVDAFYFFADQRSFFIYTGRLAGVQLMTWYF